MTIEKYGFTIRIINKWKHVGITALFLLFSSIFTGEIQPFENDALFFYVVSTEKESKIIQTKKIRAKKGSTGARKKCKNAKKPCT